MWTDWLVFCDCGFQSVWPLMEKDKRLMEASWWERLTEGETGSCSEGQMLSKSLIQFSVEGQGCVPSLLIDLRPNYDGGNENNGSLLQKVPCSTATVWPWPCSRPPLTHASVPLLLESPLDSTEIQPGRPEGNQSWVFIGGTGAEAETPILWPPDGKNWLIWKDPDAGKDWRWKEKGTTEDEMVGWLHRLNRHEFE